MAVETFVDSYKRYYRLVLTVAQQRLVGHGGAEDVTAEVFRIVWSHHQGGGELSLPWVYQTLRNVVGNEYRLRHGGGNYPRTHRRRRRGARERPELSIP